MREEVNPVAEYVVLVDDAGQPQGTALKSEVHTHDTPLHLAFSNYLRNSSGQLLVTRRALSKLTWPGVWTNSYCGHPAPGEDPRDAVRRRASQEIGLDPAHIVSISPALPDYSYRAVDSAGIVEYEVCPVFVSQLSDAAPPLAPRPAEIDSYAWVAVPDILAAVEATPFAFSPWMVEQLSDARLRDALLAPA